MSINSELERLDAVRDALVSSVNGKGGSLAADATLWQVKAGVDAIEQGGGECNHPVVIQPSPTVSVNSNTGVVTAKCDFHFAISPYLIKPLYHQAYP